MMYPVTCFMNKMWLIMIKHNVLSLYFDLFDSSMMLPDVVGRALVEAVCLKIFAHCLNASRTSAWI